MPRIGGLQPYEIVAAAGRGTDGGSGGRSVLTPLARRPKVAGRRRMTLTLTPLGAFAAGALVVTGLALAWSIGRHTAQTRARQAPRAATSLDEVRRLPAVPYDELPVDRGPAD